MTFVETNRKGKKRGRRDRPRPRLHTARGSSSSAALENMYEAKEKTRD